MVKGEVYQVYPITEFFLQPISQRGRSEVTVDPRDSFQMSHEYMFWPRLPYFDVIAQSFNDYCDLDLIDSDLIDSPQNTITLGLFLGQKEL